MSENNSSNNFGYQPDYAERSRLLRLWHQTGEDRESGQPDPFHYDDSVAGLSWTEDPGRQDGDTAAYDNIERVYFRIKAQDATKVVAAAEAWTKMANALQDMIFAVGNTTDHIAQGGDGKHAWRSPAADAFFAKGPGAAMTSLADWRDAANANEEALTRLSSIINDYHRQNEDLYKRYQQALQTAENAWNDAWMGSKVTTGWLKDTDQGNRNMFIDMLKRVREGKLDNDAPEGSPAKQIYDALGGNTNWSKLARDLQFKMAKEYSGVISKLISDGRAERYAGPTNATSVPQETIQNALYGSMASGLPKGLGTPPSFSAPSFSVPPFVPPDLNLPLPPDPNGPLADLPNAPGAGPAPGTGDIKVDVPVADQQAPGLSPLPALGGLPGVVPGLPGQPGDQPGTVNANAPGLSPSMVPGVTNFNLTANAQATGLANGLLNAPGLSGPGVPPMASVPTAKKDKFGKDNRRGLTNGVLGVDREQTAGPGGPAPTTPAAGVSKSQRQGRSTPQALGVTGAEGTFAEASSQAPTTPPVLGRPPSRTDKQAAPGMPPGMPVAREGFTPPGTTPPVLGGRRAAVPGRQDRGLAQPATTPTAPPPGSEWLTQPGADSPPPTSPVVEAARPAQPQPAWHEEMRTPTSPGAISPVLGRTEHAPATPGQRHTGRPAPDTSTRRGTTAGSQPVAAPTQAEEALSKVVGDEEAFSVETPGGAVFGNTPDRKTYEVEPKPILGAN